LKAIPKPLPAHEDSERAVLGWLLLENSAWEEASCLTETDFCLHSHQRIFAYIRSRLSIKRPIDTILLTDALRRSGELDSIGGPGYVCHLTELLPRHMYLDAHVVLLKEKANLRRIIGACHDASVRAYAQEDSSAIMERLRTQLERP
jgi:replicative DNA helicase